MNNGLEMKPVSAVHAIAWEFIQRESHSVPVP